MSHYHQQAAFYDNPILLTDKERENPYQVLEDFYDDYRLSELRHIIWEMVETCLTTDNIPYKEPEARANLLNRANDIEIVFETVHVIAMLRRKDG